MDALIQIFWAIVAFGILYLVVDKIKEKRKDRSDGRGGGGKTTTKLPK